LDEFCSVVQQIRRLRRVVLHGVGEPLLNKDLPAMIAHLKGRSKPPWVLFNSNAILLTPEWQEALLAVGLDEYRISMDAAHAELYARIRGVDAFDEVVSNVAAFSRRIQGSSTGCKLSLWCTAMQGNLADLPELIRLAHRLGVGEVYVQRMVYHGHGLAREEQAVFCVMQEQEEMQLGEAESLAARLGVSLRASGATTPRESLRGSDQDRRPWSKCRRPTSLMYITANGNVLPCCLSPFTTRDYPGLILGNVFWMSLAEIWNGDAYERFRARLQSDTPWEACDRCGVYWSL
jgi:MoaA/NifB/PqqE/SkfB family radical SAM enzyme